MPLNICLNSFAQQVRDLVAAHPDGITVADIARRLGTTRARIHTIINDDQTMVVTDPYYYIVWTAAGEKILFPADGRAEYVYRPRTKTAVAPQANPNVIKPFEFTGTLPVDELPFNFDKLPSLDLEPPVRQEETRRETFPEMMDRMATELARRYLDDAPSVGVTFSMLFAAKVRAHQESM